MAFAVTKPTVKATGSLLLDTVIATDVVVVGERTYTFVATPAAEGDVDVGASDTVIAASLVLAINGTGTPGATTYFAGTLQPDGITATSEAGLVTLTAKVAGEAGNALHLASPDATVTVVAMQGGVGAGVVAFLESVLLKSQVPSEVVSDLKAFLGDNATDAALP